MIRRVVVGCLVALLAGCTTAVAVPGPIAVPAPPVRVLQMNLCGSGVAGCFTGRSTAEAAAVIRAEQPDLVTLNEVCQDDVAALERALGAGAVSAFQPARNGPTGEPYRCRSGQQYGIGVVSRWPTVPGAAAAGGIYPPQDGHDPEQRAWLCLDVAATPALALCTTHLAYTERAVASAQCRYLFGTVISAKSVPVVMGGDLNLEAGGGPELAACLPVASASVDDAGVQHVVATPEFVVTGSRTIDMRATTDHPGLLVTLARRNRTP